MGINVGRAISQANALGSYADQLIDIKRRLNQFKGTVNNGWKADEVTYLNSAIDRINNEITRISNQLDSINSAIISVAYEIRQEEIERERREREERERARREAEERRAKQEG